MTVSNKSLAEALEARTQRTPGPGGTIGLRLSVEQADKLIAWVRANEARISCGTCSKSYASKKRHRPGCAYAAFFNIVVENE